MRRCDAAAGVTLTPYLKGTPVALFPEVIVEPPGGISMNGADVGLDNCI